MIKAVLFDLGDVITDGNASSIRRHLISLGVPEARARESSVPAMRRLNRGEVDIDAFASQVSAASGVRLSPDDAAAVLLRASHPQERMAGMVESMAGSCRLAIASNNNYLVARELSRKYPDFLALFEKRFFSFEMGAAKPERRFFEYILDSMQLPAHECLLVDDKEENCEAARALGMSAIKFEDAAQLERELKALELL